MSKKVTKEPKAKKVVESIGRQPHPRGCNCWRCQDDRFEYSKPEYRRGNDNDCDESDDD